MDPSLSNSKPMDLQRTPQGVTQCDGQIVSGEIDDACANKSAEQRNNPRIGGKMLKNQALFSIVELCQFSFMFLPQAFFSLKGFLLFPLIHVKPA